MTAQSGPSFQPPEPEYELVMPFVVCSPDGPYDALSFIAGVTMQALWTRLEVGKPDRLSHYVAPELVPQLDLIAMKFGYVLTTIPWDEHPDEWTLAEFVAEAFIEPEQED